MQHEPPLVSVITPSYNQGRFIEETILSVKNQTCPSIEHIIVDGGSTDNTLEIIKKHKGAYNMRWLSEPDNGQSDAINKGFKMARGKILSWLNSDDTYLPKAIETAAGFLNDRPEVSMVYGDCNLINEQGELIGQCEAGEFDLKVMLCERNLVPQPATFFRREVLDKIGYLDAELHNIMDWEFWLRIYLGNLKLAYMPELFANFRTYPDSKTASGAHKIGLERLFIADKIFSSPEFPSALKAMKSRIYSNANLQTGLGCYAQYQMKEARKYLVKSIRLYPPQIINPRVVVTLVKSVLGKRLVTTLRGWKTKSGGN